MFSSSQNFLFRTLRGTTFHTQSVENNLNYRTPFRIGEYLRRSWCHRNLLYHRV